MNQSKKRKGGVEHYYIHVKYLVTFLFLETISFKITDLIVPQ